MASDEDTEAQQNPRLLAASNMKYFLALACMVLVSQNGVTAFSPLDTRTREPTALSMSADSRRTFLNRVAATSAAAAGGLTIGVSGGVSPANALGGGVSKVNAKLQGYGLPPFSSVPNGFTPLAQIYGKGKNRFPIMVQFAHPSDWVVVTPSVDANGEDGTVQAGEYAKGDSATFFVYEEPGSVKDIASKPKEFFQDAIISAISQKGNNVYQSFKVTKVQPFKAEFRDQQYVIVDFKYELLTGAGFQVDRNGIASVTSTGNAVEILWCASTRQRYKKMEPVLRNIAESFRCYADGFKLSEEVVEDGF